MALNLLAGPANAGKVALLLERYLAALESDPFLIVPNRPDVDRAERELLRRSGALVGGSIGTFDDLFRLIAHGNGARRRVVSDVQRTLLLRRVVTRVTGARTSVGSARFGGFADALAATVAELESALLEPGELDGELAELYGAYREELDRLDLWDRELERRHAADRVAGELEGRIRLGQTPFGQALLSLLRYVWLEGERRDLFAFLRSPYSGIPRAHADFLEGRLRGRAVNAPERVEEEVRKLRPQPLPLLEALRAAEDPLAAVKDAAREMVRAAYGLEAPPTGGSARLDLRAHERVAKLVP